MCWTLHVGWQELIKEKEKAADRAVRHAQCLATLKFIGELTKFRLAPPTVRQLCTSQYAPCPHAACQAQSIRPARLLRRPHEQTASAVGAVQLHRMGTHMHACTRTTHACAKESTQWQSLVL